MRAVHPCAALLMSVGVILFGCETRPDAAAWETAGPVVLTVFAEGVQTYRCEAWADGKLTWKPTGPQAELFDDQHKSVGAHAKVEAGVQWEVGGDTIVGTKFHDRASAKAGAIPELQLTCTCTGGGATFGKVVLIERLDTEGGVAPTTEGHKAGDDVKVQYKARYVFHAAKG